jgi:MFS family permease
MGSVSSVPGYLKVVGLDDGSQHTKLLIGTVNAMYWVGVAIGAFGVGVFSDTVGRRRALITCLIFATITIPIFTALQNFAWAITCRLINGLAIGATDSVGLNWTAESANHQHRGRAIGLELAFAPLTASIAYFMVYGLQLQTTSEIAWRLPIAFQLVFVFMIFSAVWLLPESPRWLVRMGYPDEARDVLTAIRATGEDQELGDVVETELRKITEALQEEELHNLSTTYWRMFLVQDALRTPRRSWSAFFVQLATQFMVGSGLIASYGIGLFETGGFDSSLATVLAGGAILTQSVFGFVGAFFADKMGRRVAMYGGSAISSVIMLLVGVCGYFVAKYAESDIERAKPYGTAIITLVYIFCAVFGVTWCKYDPSQGRLITG